MAWSGLREKWVGVVADGGEEFGDGGFLPGVEGGVGEEGVESFGRCAKGLEGGAGLGYEFGWGGFDEGALEGVVHVHGRERGADTASDEES